MRIHELKDCSKRTAFHKHGLIRCPLCQDLRRPFGKLMPESLYVCSSCTERHMAANGRTSGVEHEAIDMTANEWLLDYLIKQPGQVRSRDVHRDSPFSRQSINMAFSRFYKEGQVRRLSVGVYELMVGGCDFDKKEIA